MSDATETRKRVWIPKVSKRRIRELAKRIKPTVRFQRDGKKPFWSSKGYPYYIKPVDLFKVAYTLDPEPIDEATGLKLLCDIRTYHTNDDRYRFFWPLVAEVLAQIPAEHLDKVVAFEIVRAPTAESIDREMEATTAGYHVATTWLYVRE